MQKSQDTSQNLETDPLLDKEMYDKVTGRGNQQDECSEVVLLTPTEEQEEFKGGPEWQNAVFSFENLPKLSTNPEKDVEDEDEQDTVRSKQMSELSKGFKEEF